MLSFEFFASKKILITTYNVNNYLSEFYAFKEWVDKMENFILSIDKNLKISKFYKELLIYIGQLK